MRQVAAGQAINWQEQQASAPIRPARIANASLNATRTRPANPTSPHQASTVGRRRPRRAAARRRRAIVLTASIAALLAFSAAVAVTITTLRDAEFTAGMSVKAHQLMVAAGLGIDQVNVTGQRYALDSEILDAIDLPNVRTFADLDMDAVLKRIERISWIETAQMTRVYPGTLAVTVTERTPVVLWSRAGIDYLVDATGRLLGPAPTGNAWKLPRVVGEGADREAAMLLTAIERYPELSREMAYAERIAERRWRIVLTSGSRIELGADRESEGLDRVASSSALAKTLSSGAYIADVRTPGRIALRPLSADDQQAKNVSLHTNGGT